MVGSTRPLFLSVISLFLWSLGLPSTLIVVFIEFPAQYVFSYTAFAWGNTKIPAAGKAAAGRVGWLGPRIYQRRVCVLQRIARRKLVELNEDYDILSCYISAAVPIELSRRFEAATMIC